MISFIGHRETINPKTVTSFSLHIGNRLICYYNTEWKDKELKMVDDVPPYHITVP
ncbi:MAG: hypothetical protein M3162_04050 [Thermoproteota archaeon]|nr:hypothetical protein [Thermoproteota archaeon]